MRLFRLLAAKSLDERFQPDTPVGHGIEIGGTACPHSETKPKVPVGGHTKGAEGKAFEAPGLGRTGGETVHRARRFAQLRDRELLLPQSIAHQAPRPLLPQGAATRVLRS